MSDEPFRKEGRSGAETRATVDLTRMQETSGGDLAFERELTDLFLDDNDARIVRLEALIALGDLTTAKREAHTLKGSSANVGANGLAACTLLLEEACARGDLEAALRSFAQVREELVRVKELLRAYIASLGA